MEGNVLVKTALGRPFVLGMLYDCRTDQLVPSVRLWSEKSMREFTSVTYKPSSNTEMISGDSIGSKSSKMDIDANLKLSFLGGLVSVSGSAKFLHDKTSSSRQSRVTLQYKCTSRFEQLTMDFQDKELMQNTEQVFSSKISIATHIVTGVEYGADAFFVFDKEVSENEEFKEVHGSMQAAIKGLVSVTGEASVGMEEKETKEASNFKCTFYGDVQLERNPITFKEAIQVYNNLPSIIGTHSTDDRTVPKKVWLAPLSWFDSKAACLVREISENLIDDAQKYLDEFDEIRRNGITLKMSTSSCDAMRNISKQVSRFLDLLDKHVNTFKHDLALLLPEIRGKGKEEAELATLLQKISAPPYDFASLHNWVDRKIGEVKVLKWMLQQLIDSKGEYSLLYE